MVRYQLSIKATHLSRGMLRRPSPYAEVRYADGPEKGRLIDKTETLKGTSNPDFVKLLFFHTSTATITRLMIRLYDDRETLNDALLAEVTVEATEVFQSKGHTQSISIGRGRSHVDISVIESNPTSMGTVSLQLRGLDIRNVEPGLLGLGRSDPFFEIGKKDADHASGQVRWNVVYRSEHKDNHLNPFFAPFKIGIEELCNGDLDATIRIAVLDHNKHGNHKFIGAAETTLAKMIANVSVKGNADRDVALELYMEGDQNRHGLMIVLQAEVHEPHDV